MARPGILAKKSRDDVANAKSGTVRKSAPGPLLR